MKKGIIIVFAALFFTAFGVAGAYFLSISKGNKTSIKVPSTQVVLTPAPMLSPPISTPTPTPIPTEDPGEVVIPSNWSTYTNSTYGFSISFPSDYQALDGQNDLYGWPNGAVLLYNGGQAYDIVIEVWDTQAEYQAKYTNPMGEMLTQMIGEKYITVVDQTLEGDASDIIATFKVLN